MIKYNEKLQKHLSEIDNIINYEIQCSLEIMIRFKKFLNKKNSKKNIIKIIY